MKNTMPKMTTREKMAWTVLFVLGPVLIFTHDFTLWWLR